MPTRNEFSGLTVEQLKTQKAGLEDRIARIQRDLKEPLEADLEEQAVELRQREILQRILTAEIEFHGRITRELNSRMLLA